MHIFREITVQVIVFLTKALTSERNKCKVKSVFRGTQWQDKNSLNLDWNPNSRRTHNINFEAAVVFLFNFSKIHDFMLRSEMFVTAQFIRREHLDRRRRRGVPKRCRPGILSAAITNKINWNELIQHDDAHFHLLVINKMARLISN